MEQIAFKLWAFTEQQIQVTLYAPIKVMPHLPARSMERPAERGIRSSSMDICGSKVNVIVRMLVQYELFLMNAQQKIESIGYDGHASSMQKHYDSWTRSLVSLEPGSPPPRAII